MTGSNRFQRGFTLMELLIVVAIIGVLVAIAIPMFTTQLEKAREATDEANSRSAMAVAVAGYMDGSLTPGVRYYYNLSGFITTKPEPYGRGTEGDGGTTFPSNSYGMSYSPTEDYTQSVIYAFMEPGATYPVVKWDKVGISLTQATSIAQVIRGLNIPGDYWSESHGMLNGGRYLHQDDLDNTARIESALIEAGYDPSTLSYTHSARTGALLITLDGKLETSDLGERVAVVQYNPKTGETEVGTALVGGGSISGYRATVALTDFQPSE